MFRTYFIITIGMRCQQNGAYLNFGPFGAINRDLFKRVRIIK